LIQINSPGLSNNDFLVKPAEERLFAKIKRTGSRQPVGDFVTSQIKSKGLELGKQRSPNIWHGDDNASRDLDAAGAC
jgi:hypothetical protein